MEKDERRSGSTPVSPVAPRSIARLIDSQPRFRSCVNLSLAGTRPKRKTYSVRGPANRICRLFCILDRISRPAFPVSCPRSILFPPGRVDLSIIHATDFPPFQDISRTSDCLFPLAGRLLERAYYKNGSVEGAVRELLVPITASAGVK